MASVSMLKELCHCVDTDFGCEDQQGVNKNLVTTDMKDRNNLPQSLPVANRSQNSINTIENTVRGLYIRLAECNTAAVF